MKLAVVASGWHFPVQFYEEMSKQVFDGEVDLFCVSHRDPVDDKNIATLGDTFREKMDKILYRKIASRQDIESLGWQYKLHPNTIGDWGCSNQWLEENDWKKYDAFLFTHDDNYINSTEFLQAGVDGLGDIVSNSTGMPAGWLRGSCEFFSKDVIEKLGGKFDLSRVSLTREGKTDTPSDKNALLDWNMTVYPLMEFIQKEGLRITALSPFYRVSPYCIEGERGFIHKTHGSNTHFEEQGLKQYYGSL